jgi:hypothetical protein
MFPAGISGQFPEWGHLPQGNILTLRMVSSSDLEVQVFTSSVELPLKASETVIPLFIYIYIYIYIKNSLWSSLQNDKCCQFPAISKN